MAIPYNLAEAPFTPSMIYDHCFEVKENPETMIRILQGESFNSILLQALQSKFNHLQNEDIRGWLLEFVKTWKAKYDHS